MAKNNDFKKEPHYSWLYRVLNWPRKTIQRMYAWMMRWGDSPQAEKALFGFSFTESSFFPIPPDPLLIAMTTSNSKKWVRFGLICTAASVLGALLGYLIGFALFETVGQAILNTYHLHHEFEQIGEKYQENAFLAIFTAGFTPIPFKVFTLAAGVFRVNIALLIIASILSRGGRFFLVAWLTHHFGAKYKDKIEKYIDLFSLAFVAILILGFVSVKYLF